MLANRYRLTSKKDFTKVKKKGTDFHGRMLFLSILDRGDNEPSRFGFIITNNVLKQAAKRNRIKRILRDAVQRSIFLMKDGFDCVLIARHGVEKLSREELTEDVEKLFTKADLLKEYVDLGENI